MNVTSENLKTTSFCKASSKVQLMELFHLMLITFLVSNGSIHEYNAYYKINYIALTSLSALFFRIAAIRKVHISYCNVQSRL